MGTEGGDAGDPVTWDALLDAAVSAGLSQEAFWSMTLRESMREIKMRRERQRQEQEAAWWRTAAETSALMNMIGAAVAGSKWRAVPPKDLFDQWTGRAESAETTRDRLERAKRMHAALSDRQKPKPRRAG